MKFVEDVAAPLSNGRGLMLLARADEVIE